MSGDDLIKQRFSLLRDNLDERMRRLVAAAEAQVAGYGGVSAVARATGVSRRAIALGIAELKPSVSTAKPEANAARIRRPGGGRKKAAVRDVTLMADLERLKPLRRGDPPSPLRWTCKSLRQLAAELGADGHAVSHRVVGELLEELGYSLQSNRKTLEGSDPLDRNAQFELINQRTLEELAQGNPVIAVATKKQEFVGEFPNCGREFRPKGESEKVRVPDLILPELGRANPSGVFEVARNVGWVSVGVDHDTAAFAVESIRRWWRMMGAAHHPKAQRLQIFAAGGGSDGSRVRWWQVELQQLVEELGFPIRVCHLPPGTSKWNKIEHRLFSSSSQHWRGRPPISHEVTLSLIKATTTGKG